MAKIVQVVNAMISNEKAITNVARYNDSYFFLYNNKHKWSIHVATSFEGKESVSLSFYPTQMLNISELAAGQIEDIEEYRSVNYNTEDLKTREAHETFKELYQIISGKLYGLDDIFDEIIREDELSF